MLFYHQKKLTENYYSATLAIGRRGGYNMLKTLNQSLLVLNLFTKEKQLWTAREVADTLSLNQVTVYRILETFTKNHYLSKIEETKQYEIGSALAIFSYLSYDKYNIVSLIQPFLYNLMQETGESVYLVKYDYLEATPIDAYKPENKVSFAVSLNKPMPLYSGASYWAILAHLDEEKIEMILNDPFDHLRKSVKLTPTLLRKQIDKVLTDGWCVSQELITPDVVAIAAPIFSNDEIIGSITVGKPTYRTTKEDIQPLGQLVKTTANQISCILSEKNLNFNSYQFFKERAQRPN